jgi:hypothetical protein
VSPLGSGFVLASKMQASLTTNNHSRLPSLKCSVFQRQWNSIKRPVQRIQTMRAISRDEIEVAWDALCELNEEQTSALVKRFMEEQPALGIYLSVSFESLDGDAESPLIDVIMGCWQAMSQASDGPLRLVTPDEIESVEQANTEELERLEEAAEIEWNDAVRSLIQDYNQRELLGFGIEMLMSGNEEAPELAPDTIGLEMLCLKTVLDCLDRSDGARN